MRKTLLTLIAALAVAGAAAQNTIGGIQKRYADIKQTIAQMSEENGYPPEYYQLNVVQNLPGTGPHREDIRMYYEEEECNEGEVYPPHRITFATSSYNFAARRFYEEYLYDTDGKPAFIYTRTPDLVPDAESELRLYFSQGRLIWASLKCRPDERQHAEAAEFQEVSSGAKLPATYSESYDSLLARAEKLRELFRTVDGATYK
ncbi:MAG: hypothetical protein IJ722_01595 [Alloprevotella sp.]|nr:hypothetical protein [Alloprevotella sp.]